MSDLMLEQNRQRNRGKNENPRQPGRGLGEQIGGRTRPESGLRALSAESGGQIGALALLQQDDHDQQHANDDVDGGNENNHGVCKNLGVRRRDSG